MLLSRRRSDPWPRPRGRTPSASGHAHAERRRADPHGDGRAARHGLPVHVEEDRLRSGDLHGRRRAPCSPRAPGRACPGRDGAHRAGPRAARSATVTTSSCPSSGRAVGATTAPPPYWRAFAQMITSARSCHTSAPARIVYSAGPIAQDLAHAERHVREEPRRRPAPRVELRRDVGVEPDAAEVDEQAPLDVPDVDHPLPPAERDARAPRPGPRGCRARGRGRCRSRPARCRARCRSPRRRARPR